MIDGEEPAPGQPGIPGQSSGQWQRGDQHTASRAATASVTAVMTHVLTRATAPTCLANVSSAAA